MGGGPHDLGRRGERIAEAYLVARGWVVRARNYRFGRREVDLVVFRDGVLAFVEVKTRAGKGFGDPLEAITRRKRREIEAVAARYVSGCRLHDVRIRFDAVAVTREAGGGLRVRHVPDAWRPQPGR